MTKPLLAGLVFAVLASMGARPADAQDIRGRWIYSENSPDMLTTTISEIGGDGIFRWTLLAKRLSTGQAAQTTCVGRYRYDGHVVTTQWAPSCTACEGASCAAVPTHLLLGNGDCAIQWQDANTFVNCQGAMNHRY